MARVQYLRNISETQIVFYVKKIWLVYDWLTTAWRLPDNWLMIAWRLYNDFVMKTRVQESYQTKNLMISNYFDYCLYPSFMTKPFKEPKSLQGFRPQS